MVKSSRHIVPHRRRRGCKTNYHKRLKLLKSNKSRLVVRKSLKHIRAQIIEFDPRGDKTIVSATSEELKKFGWKFYTNNLPSAYLVGLLIGKRAKENKIKSAILDTGLYRITRGSKLFALLKGAVDAGLDVPHSKDMLPDEERLKGLHISSYAKMLKSNKKFKMRFSYNPENITKIFEETKEKILRG